MLSLSRWSLHEDILTEIEMGRATLSHRFAVFSAMKVCNKPLFYRGHHWLHDPPLRRHCVCCAPLLVFTAVQHETRPRGSLSHRATGHRTPELAQERNMPCSIYSRRRVHLRPGGVVCGVELETGTRVLEAARLQPLRNGSFPASPTDIG